ncbi:MMPL family transporter [Nevskia ramosa]|uniref:MMPL family transporter n=1 Tax=Nevskia ramosa TaxID=64002 RepID=UPI00235269A7|nr:MMPL family transporter [Nevskia ramosa]
MNTVAWLGSVAQHPRRVLLAVALATVIGLLLCIDPVTRTVRFHIDPSAEALLPVDDPGRAVLDQVRRTFGIDDPLIVAVRFEPSVYSAENLERIAKLSAQFKQLPEVSEVFSLATAPNLLASGDEIDVTSFTDQAARDPAVVQTFAAQMLANPLYRSTLVSDDGTTAAFALSTTAALTPKQYVALDFDGQVRRAVQEVGGADAVYLTGTLPVRAATSGALDRTLRFTVPAVFAVIAVLLLATFRSPMAAASALLSVAIALIWTVASAVLLGIEFNLVSAIVPPLVITIGLSYTIHLLAAHFLSRSVLPDARDSQRADWVMKRISTGLTLSATTTVIGFLSLLLNPLPAVRGFAVLASLGTLYVGALTHLFLPALLNATGCNRETPPIATRVFGRFAELLTGFDLRWRRWIIGASALLIVGGFISASRIEGGADFINSFDGDTPVRQNFEAVAKAFNGANFVTVLIDGKAPDALTNPALIDAVDSFQDWLRAQPEVGAAVSFVDQLKLTNLVLHNNEPLYFGVPADGAAVKQILLFASSEALNRVIDPQYRTAVISLRLNVDGSTAIGAFLRRAEARAAELPSPIDARFTGSAVLATRAVEALAGGHLASIAIAVVAIGALLSLMFTSIKAGLIATVPNIVPIAVYFGTLGALGIPLNPTTSLIACIVLGIAVNDTVHFLARFNADAREQGTEAGAVRSALGSVLRPITLATVCLCLGFLVFAGSELNNQRQFGGLAAWTLFVAWIVDMTLTPALGSRLRIVTLWDLLRLDLGKSPQHTIPLLSGLSMRQARLFALMSRLEKHPAGTRIIQEGDLSRDIYVVVDGAVEATIERNEERLVLSTMTRGAVMGEAGYFGQRRTASVDTTSPVRLLRFNSQDLERLRERYPSIAATVFRNLNRIQAERIARMTALLR